MSLSGKIGSKSVKVSEEESSIKICIEEEGESKEYLLKQTFMNLYNKRVFGIDIPEEDIIILLTPWSAGIPPVPEKMMIIPKDGIITLE